MKLSKFLSILFAGILPVVGYSAVPGQINYQGYLKDNNDVAITGSRSAVFRLYDNGGSIVWTETHNVNVDSGVFSVQLGTQNSLINALKSDVSLGVKFGSDSEMSPRQNLQSVPYAIHSKTTEIDTLNSLNCSTGQIAKWSGSAWACADDAAGSATQSIIAGSGLSKTGTASDITLSVANSGVTGSMIASGQVVKGVSINGGGTIKDSVNLNAGTGVSLAQSGNTITLNSTSSAPAINAGSGLEKTGTATNITLGISNASVSGAMIASGQVVKGVSVGGGSAIKDTVNLTAGTGINLIQNGSTVTLSASSSAPSNMVTTDTTQIIDANKTFDNPVIFNDDVTIGGVGNFEGVDIYGEVELRNYISGARYLEISNDASNNILLNNPASGGDFYISDDLHIKSSVSDSTYDDLYVDNIYADSVYSKNSSTLSVRMRDEDQSITYGTISYNSNGIQINPTAGTETVWITDNAKIGDDLYVQDNVVIDDQLKLTYGPALKPGGGSWGSSSDKRLKKNILPLQGGSLDKVLQLSPISYQWINPEEHGALDGEIGFLAQDIEKIFPNWVKEVQPEGKDKELVEGKAKALSFPHEFNAYLVGAIQELHKQNQQLKKILCKSNPDEELCQ